MVEEYRASISYSLSSTIYSWSKEKDTRKSMHQISTYIEFITGSTESRLIFDKFETLSWHLVDLVRCFLLLSFMQEFREPQCWIFRISCETVHEVDEHEPESDCVTLLPLEIVAIRPYEITLYIHLLTAIYQSLEKK